MSFLLWLLGTLTAISFIGDYPYAALALVALAGAAFGLNCYLEHPLASDSSPMPPSSLEGKKSLAIRYGWLVDIAATLLLVFPSRWMVVGFLLVLFSWLLRWWAHGQIISRTVFDLPILALWLMVPISLWASADLSVSLIPLAQITAGINVFYAIVARVQTERDLRRALIGLVAFGVLLALIAPFAVGWIDKAVALPKIYTDLRRLWPEGIQPNLMAGALALIFAVGVAVFVNAPFAWLTACARRVRRVGLGLSLAAILVILLATQSRGALAATAAGLFLLMAFKSRATFGVALAGSAVAIAFVATHYDLTRFGDAFFSNDAIPNLAGRLEIWSRAIYALQDVPYTGIGLGMFAKAVPVLYPLFLVGPDVDIGYAHNVFLQVGVDLGIPGLVAYVALMMLGLLVAWRAYRSARERKQLDLAAVALGLTIALVVVMLHGLVDSAIWDTKPAILSWVLFGLITVVGRQTSAWDVRPETLSVRRRAAEEERAWFETEGQKRALLDRLLYAPPAFDEIVQAGAAFLDPQAGERVLDLGCGQGSETEDFARKGVRVVGVDISYAQLCRSRSRLAASRLESLAEFVQADAENLPFCSGSFRSIYGKAVLHHTSLDESAQEIHRLLRKDGRATFAEPLAHNPLFWLMRRLTPHWRTPHEHPLTLPAIFQFVGRFESWDVEPKFLLAPFVCPLRLLPAGEDRAFRPLHRWLENLDGWTFSHLPFFSRLAWYGLIKVSNPDCNEAPHRVPGGQRQAEMALGPKHVPMLWGSLLWMLPCQVSTLQKRQRRPQKTKRLRHLWLAQLKRITLARH